jgi:tetratricopeptide (TPR) repeat protein
LNNRGLVQHARGNRAAALADFEQALQLRPSYPEALNNRGSIRQGQGNLDEALADFEAALRLEPDYLEALNNRGTARQALGDLAGALADFDQVLAVLPAACAAVIYHNRGAARQALGDLAGARADFDEALQLEPRQAQTWDHRGLVRQAQGDLDGALADFEQALLLTLPGAAAPLYHHRGGVRVLRNDFAGAIADYNRALMLEPEAYLVYISRGNARYHLRDPRGFVDYRTALRLNPAGAVAEMVRLLAEDATRDAAAVLDNCDKHLRLNDCDLIAHVRKGLTLILLGRPGEGEESLRTVVALLPEGKEPLDLVVSAVRSRVAQASGSTSRNQDHSFFVSGGSSSIRMSL